MLNIKYKSREIEKKNKNKRRINKRVKVEYLITYTAMIEK